MSARQVILTHDLIRDFECLGIMVNVRGAAEQRVACPRCAKTRRDTALSVNIESGVYHCFRCRIAGRAGRESTRRGRPPIIKIDDPDIVLRKQERSRRTWGETVPLTDSKAHAARTYLESRALGEVLRSPPVVLRAHPGLSYWDDGRDLGRYPAMVALFAGASGQAVTLHLTYLRHDGCAKASVPSPKKMLPVPVRGATQGGAIHLYEPCDGKLGIAEGIESALILHILQHVPVWASYCADNLARVHLPPDLQELHIGTDIDASGTGEKVARALAARVSKLNQRTQIWFVKPGLAGPGDLNDQLLRRRTAIAATQAES